MAKSKRLKKKQQTQKVFQKLQSQGYSEKEIKRLPKNEKVKASRKIRDAEYKQQRRAKNERLINKLGLNESYTYNGKEYKGSKLKDLSPETLKKFGEVQKRRDRDRRRYEKNKASIMNAGYSSDIAEKYKTKKLAVVNEVIHKGDRTVYKSKKYLSVTWADVTGESQMHHALHQYDNMSTTEMISEIHRLHKESENKKSIKKDPNSPEEKYFFGVAKITVGSDKEEIKEVGKQLFKKGYTKRMVTEDTQLLTSNEFTVRGYANMMLSVMSRAKPEHRQQYFNELEHFAYNNLPEIHRQIFR